MAKAGRKRKINVVRDASGKSRGEIFDPNFHFNQPHRRDFMAVLAGRKLDHTEPKLMNQAGYPLGRLRIALAITSDQLRAGNEFNALARSYGRQNGMPLPTAKSCSMSERISSGVVPISGEVSADEILRRERHTNDMYAACFEALDQLERTHGTGNRIRKVIREICITEQDERQVWRDDVQLGNLRLGLNALFMVFKKAKILDEAVHS